MSFERSPFPLETPIPDPSPLQGEGRGALDRQMIEKVTP